MKTPSQDYINAEEAIERKPVELYHVWKNDDSEHWRYTDGDVDFDYDGNTYETAALSRDGTKYNSKLEAQTLKIKADYLQDAVSNFIAINPIDILWVSVMKLHRDQSPPEASVVFIGQIRNVLFQGVKAEIHCVGFEYFLKKLIPLWRYQLNCNHNVFDDNCALTKASYKTTTTITLDATGLILSSSDFGAQADGYFTGGEIVFGTESRTVSAHVGNNVTIMYQFLELESSDSVDAYPGCDGRAETCRDKYDNINQFLGFPNIPVENPGLRVSW